MTTNEPPNQLEWFIRARSGVDSDSGTGALEAFHVR